MTPEDEPAAAAAPGPRELSRADFLGEHAPELEGLVPTAVPDPRDPASTWGVVYLRRFGGRQRDDWEIRQFELASEADEADRYYLARNISAELVQLATCSSDGAPLFPTRADAAALGDRPGLGGVLRWLYEEVRRVNLMRPEDEAQLAGKSGAA